jgi:acyl-CoA synthetase (AMP-forming)/AMP-acid ligase II
MKLGLLLADCAMRFPAREAVICDDRRVTFRELDDRANRIANALLALGLGPGERVALYLPNSAELVEAMMGIANAGALMVPISTRLTTSEVKFIFEDCRPFAIFFSPEFRDAACAASANLAGVELIAVGPPVGREIGYEAMIAAASPARPPALPPEPDDLVIGYTSGTTGRPKGAIATHKVIVTVHGFMNSIEWGLTAEDRCLVTTPMAHRTGLGRVANCVCLGSSIVILPKFEPAAAVDLIARENCTLLGCVPTIARMMLPEIERRPEACRPLKTLVATGEAFPVDIKTRLLEALPHLRIFSFYAQTESGFVACLRPEEQTTHAASIGRPVPGVEIRIVDANMREVPDGEPGEVLVRCGTPGAFMTMRAYYNRPEATAETILEGGWIRTGDAARRDKDGYLYFVDRVRDMIVSGGLNIYSKEVELALIEHPAVADAAVIGIPDPEFGEAVMAFVERAPGASATEQELIDHCRRLIASYKKPKHVRFVDALPRTGTGKVVKNELRKEAALLVASAR